MYEDLTNKTYDYAMEYFQRHFENTVNEIFGEENIAMAFIFGSIIRGYSSYKAGYNADLDMFICLDDNTPNKEQKISNFRKWYTEFHLAHGLKPDDKWPGEIMTVSELDTALERQNKIQLKLHHNSDQTLDTVAWAPMIVEPSLKKLGNPSEIKRYQDWCTYSKAWIKQVMDILDNKMPSQEMFHRTGRFITPWLRGLINELEDKVNLQYSSKRGYYCPSGTNQNYLHKVLNEYSNSNPIKTINDPKELRKLKYNIIVDQHDGVDIKAASVFLSNPAFLIYNPEEYPKYKKPVSIFSNTSVDSKIEREIQNISILFNSQNDNDELYLLPLKWKKEIIEDLVSSHPNDIASYTIRGIIDWYHLEDEREFEIRVPPERCTFLQNARKLKSAFEQYSDILTIKKSQTEQPKINVDLSKVSDDEWNKISSGQYDIYNLSDSVSAACLIIEGITGTSLEALASSKQLPKVVDNIRYNLRENGTLKIDINSHTNNNFRIEDLFSSYEK